VNALDLKGQLVAFCASGGLDSCTVTHWLTQQGVRVITFTADLGQPDEPDLDAVAERMRQCGAEEAVIVPLRDEMANIGITAIQALARYDGGYWNTTGLGRYVTVLGLLPQIRERGINIVSHGATGRGNDQVRFQLGANFLAPGMLTYAPWRDELFLEKFPGREQMIEYCMKHKLPIAPPAESKYSTDANFLGLSHEAGELESITTPADFVVPEMGVRAADAPNDAEVVTIEFEKGRPVAINGEAFDTAPDVFVTANKIAGRNAVGINRHAVENRIVGTKSRGVYEAPGMELLGAAYEYLLQLILDRRARSFFDYCSNLLSQQYYDGLAYDVTSHAAGHAVADFASLATGKITVSLLKGSVQFVSAEDVPHSIYIEENASMEAAEEFNHADSEGYLGVVGVGVRAQSVRGQIPLAFLPHNA
jgi:argininosuccinate synthase